MSSPLISCLCVTENRPDFMPWLLWNFQRQKYPNTELVIIDGSKTPYKPGKTKGVRVVHAPGLNIPQRRNLALQEAKGDLMAWFDDDDWYHPNRLNFLSQLITDETPAAGPKLAWFVNLFTLGVKQFVMRRGVLHSGLVARTDAARSIRFDEGQERGSDIDWLNELQARHKVAETFEVPSFFLCHDQNAGNLASVHQFNRDMMAITSVVQCAWQDTTSQLEALRGRVQERAG